MDTRERIVELILIIFLYNQGSFVVISMQGKLLKLKNFLAGIDYLLV